MFDISPDGKELVFTFDSNPDPRDFSYSDIGAMDVTTRKWRTLTVRTKAQAGMAWECPRYAPNGQWIALLGTDYGKQHNEQTRAWLLERKSAKLRDWTASWDRGVQGPLWWTKDSAAVVFTAEDGVAQPIWRLGMADAAPTEVCRGPGMGGTTTDVRLSADGTTLVVARSSQQYPPTLLSCRVDGTGERSIERFNKRLLSGLQMGAAESVTVKGFGGDAVQMWVVSPPGYSKATKKKWPLMQVIHGGPHTC